MAIHSNILFWKIPCMGNWWATVHRVAKSQTEMNMQVLPLSKLLTVEAPGFEIGLLSASGLFAQ